jgi:hypothetical protein
VPSQNLSAKHLSVEIWNRDKIVHHREDSQSPAYRNNGSLSEGREASGRLLAEYSNIITFYQTNSPFFEHLPMEQRGSY